MRYKPSIFLMALWLTSSANAGINLEYQLSFGQTPSREGINLYYPSAVEVDPSNGDVFVADTQNHYIKRFTADGVFLNQWVFSGLGMAVNLIDHSIYVGSAADDKIYQFDPLGNELASWGGRGTADGLFNKPRDVAYNPANGNIFVIDSINQRVQEFTSTGTFVQSWSDPQLWNPYGIDVDPTGTYVWVANSGGAPFVKKYDMSGNEVLGFGAIGSTPPDMRWPRGIAVNAAGDVYVAATDMERVHKFNPNDGTQLQVFMGPETDEEGPAHPRGVAVNRTTGHIYTAAAYSNRIDHFDETGTFIASWGVHDRDGMFLSHPSGMTADPNNNVLYVSDTNSHLIKKFAYDGTFMGQYGNWPFVHRDETAVSFPAAITIDALGNYWALNEGVLYPDDPTWASDKFVRQFDFSGNYLSGFANADFTNNMHGILVNPVANEIYVAINKINRIKRFDFAGVELGEWGTPGSGPGEFNSPGGMALNVDRNYILVVDENNSRIQKYTLDGTFITQFGGPGSTPGLFNFKAFSQIALDPDENIYVADSLNHRIQVLDKTGKFIAQVGGTKGPGPEKFNIPISVAYDDGKLFVLEFSGKEVEVYDVTPTTVDTVWVDDSVPAGALQHNTWSWSASPVPIAGALAHHSVLQAGIHQHFFDRASDKLSISAGDTLFAYVYLDPANPPSEIMLQWRESASWKHRAYWGTNQILWGADGTDSRRYMGTLPSAGGWVRLEVPASTVGLEGKELNGMAFTLYDGNATWDSAGKSRPVSPQQPPPPPPPPPSDTDMVWVDENLPAGASQYGVWNWIDTNPVPVSGLLAHKSVLQQGIHQHLFDRATEELAVETGDTLIAYVYLDPVDPPSEIMLQWREGVNWGHRAYWGDNRITWGTDGTESRYYVGPLPALGGWVRLEVPALAVGLEGKSVNGMAFTLFDGQASWDYAGKL